MENFKFCEYGDTVGIPSSHRFFCFYRMVIGIEIQPHGSPEKYIFFHYQHLSGPSSKWNYKNMINWLIVSDNTACFSLPVSKTTQKLYTLVFRDNTIWGPGIISSEGAQEPNYSPSIHTKVIKNGCNTSLSERQVLGPVFPAYFNQWIWELLYHCVG